MLLTSIASAKHRGKTGRDRHKGMRWRRSAAVGAVIVLALGACGDDDDGDSDGGEETSSPAAEVNCDDVFSGTGDADDEAGAGEDDAADDTAGNEDAASDEDDEITYETDADVDGTVTWWIMNNGPDPQGDAEALVEPFEAATGVDVEVVVVGWEDQFNEISNAAVTGTGPDLTQVGTTQVAHFASLGGFEDLTDRVSDIGGSDSYSEGVWSTTQIAGEEENWALPWFTEARAIYYRTDVLEAAEVPADEAFTDWEHFRCTLEAIDELGEIDGQAIEPFGSPGRNAFDLVHHVMPFIWAAGGSELSEDASEATINSAEAQEGVMFYGDLLADGLYSVAELERDGTEVENQFKAGNLATWMGGPWTLASTAREDDENWTEAARNNVGIAPMPAGPSGEAFTFVGGSNLMMFEESDNQDAAWELMKYLSTPDAQLSYARLLGMFPSVTEAQEILAEDGPNEAAFLEAIEQGRTFAAIPAWGDIEGIYLSHLADVLEMAAGVGEGEYSADAVADKLEEAALEANDALAEEAGG